MIRKILKRGRFDAKWRKASRRGKRTGPGGGGTVLQGGIANWGLKIENCKFEIGAALDKIASRSPLTPALAPDGGEGEERAAKSETPHVVSYKPSSVGIGRIKRIRHAGSLGELSAKGTVPGTPKMRQGAGGELQIGD